MLNVALAFVFDFYFLPVMFYYFQLMFLFFEYFHSMHLFLSRLFYYPIMATFFFSGALWEVGWGCIGGRPKEIQRQKDEAKRNSVAQLQKGNTFDETFEDDTIV